MNQPAYDGSQDLRVAGASARHRIWKMLAAAGTVVLIICQPARNRCADPPSGKPYPKFFDFKDGPPKVVDKSTLPNALAPLPTKHFPSTAKKTQAINVSGRALDEDGKPIAGARIYMGTRTSLIESERLAETTTNAEGRYEFHQVKLPIIGGDDTQQGCGHFRVFGQAEGYGFSWRGLQRYADKRLSQRHGGSFAAFRNQVPDGLGNLTSIGHHYAHESIVLDLMFLKSATLRGRVVNEQGEPLSGAELTIQWCQQLNSKLFEKAKAENGLSDDDFGFDVLPQELIVRKTNAKGEFEFASLPSKCLLYLQVTRPDFAGNVLYAATTRGPLPNFGKFKIQTGEIVVLLQKL